MTRNSGGGNHRWAAAHCGCLQTEPRTHNPCFQHSLQYLHSRYQHSNIYTVDSISIYTMSAQNMIKAPKLIVQCKDKMKNPRIIKRKRMPINQTIMDQNTKNSCQTIVVKFIYQRRKNKIGMDYISHSRCSISPHHLFSFQLSRSPIFHVFRSLCTF